MAEFEELRLTITLVDNATAGIKAMRIELRAAEADSNRFRQRMQELTRDNRDFSTSLGQVNAQTALLAAAAGYAGSKIDELQDKVYDQLTALSRFTREIQQINNSAILLGISFGNLRSIVEQGAKFGLDEATTKNITARILALQAQLRTRAGIDAFRARLESDKDLKLDPQQLEAFIDRLRGATTEGEALAAVHDTANQIERSEFRRTQDSEIAAKLKQQWIVKVGLPAETILLKKLDTATAEYLAQQEAVLQSSKAWNERLSDLQENLNSIKDAFALNLLSVRGPFYKTLLLTWDATEIVKNNLKSWLARIKKFAAGFGKIFKGGIEGLLKNPGAGQMPPDLFGGGAKKQSFQREQLEELTDILHDINEFMRPTGPRIVPASLTTGGGVIGGGLAGTPSGGFGGPGAPFGGGGVGGGPGGGGGGPRAPGGGTGGGPAAAPPGVPAPGVPSAPAPVIPGSGTGGAPYSPGRMRLPGGGPGNAGGTTPGGTPGQRTADIPFPRSGSEAERGGALYDKLLAEFRANPPEGLPPDAAQFGITKGTPEEWARFGVSVAKAESSFNPRVENLDDPGGSHGIFQYAHGQAYGNAFDVDNSVRAFVRDVRGASTDKRGLRGATLGQRFDVIGRNPQKSIRALPLAERIAQQRQQQQPPITQAFPEGGYTPIPKAGGYNRADLSTLRAGLDRGLEPGTPPTAGAAPIDTSKLGALPDQKDRPFYVGGQLSVGGEEFRYGTGGGMGGAQRGSTPYGTYPVHLIPQLGGKGELGDIGKRIGSIATVGSEGGDLYDPKYGATRSGIQIHPVSGADLDKLYTAGCFGIPRQDWPRFKAALIRANEEAGGKLFLTVDRSGRASIGGQQVAPTVAEAAAAGVRTGPTADPAGQPIGTAQAAIKTSEFSLPAVPADYVPKVLGGTATKTAPTAAVSELDTAPEEVPQGGSSPAFNKRGGYSPVDRTFLDRQMGNKIQLPKVQGEGKISIKVAEQPANVGGTPAGLFKKDTIERQDTMGDSKKGPTVTVTGDNKDTGAGGDLEVD